MRRGDPRLSMRWCACGERVDGEPKGLVTCGNCGAALRMPDWPVGRAPWTAADREDAPTHAPKAQATGRGVVKVKRKCPRCGREWVTFPQFVDCRRCNDGTVGVPVG